MKESLIIKIVIAVATGLFSGKFVPPLLGLTSTLASFAISTGITMSDEKNIPIYLETETESNVRKLAPCQLRI
jgi:hypothetical protein